MSKIYTDRTDIVKLEEKESTDTFDFAVIADGKIAKLPKETLLINGTFTANFVGSTSGSVALANQRYVRIGNQVTAYIATTGIDLTSLVGDITITGIPNFSLSIIDGATAPVAYGENIDKAELGLFLIRKNGINALLWLTGTDGLKDFSDANIDGTTDFYITFTYEIQSI